MDSAFILILTMACLLCWLVAITDKTTPLIFRAVGIFYGVPALVYYFVFVMGATKSPVWNDIEGGPWTLVALAFGIIAFMSRKKAKSDPPQGGVLA
jgi:uncharacterized membrane protein